MVQHDDSVRKLYYELLYKVIFINVQCHLDGVDEHGPFGLGIAIITLSEVLPDTNCDIYRCDLPTGKLCFVIKCA